MSTETEKQLLLLQHRETELVGRASGLADVFVEATGQFAADWIGVHVRGEVEREHEHTLTLGQDKLRELKADVAAAQREAPGRTEDALKGLPWGFSHAPDDKAPKSSNYTSDYSPLALRSPRRAPDVVTKGLRGVLGEAGRILDKYGYPGGSNWKAGGTGYRYPYGLDLSEEANNALDAAAQVDGEVIKLRKQIIELKRQIGEARAKAAWEEA